MRILRRAVVVVAVLLVLYGGVSLYLASQVTKAERTALEDTPARVGLAYEDVAFTSRDEKIGLKGWYIPAAGGKGDVIMVHGIDSNRADTGPGDVDLMAALHGRGYNVLAFDLRGHGESADGRLSGGLFEQDDVFGAFDWLVAGGAPPGKTGLLGISMGAATSLMAASREEGIRAVVADSSFADIRDMISSEIPKRSPAPAWIVPLFIPGITLAAQARYGIDLGLIAPEESVKLMDYPILLIHCKEDPRIRLEHSERIREAAPDRSTLWTAPCDAHARAFRTDPRFYVDTVDDYFSERFGLPAR